MPWPPQQRFPTNRPRHRVHDTLGDWFFYSRRILLITGYAGLDKLLALIHDITPGAQQVRIFLGNEPQRIERPRTTQTVSEEMRQFWLHRGLSIEQCPLIETAVRRLRNRDIEVRMPADQHRRVHAKIYCADSHVMIGSSNYSQAGLHYQVEGNCLFSYREKSRYQETWELGEAIWETGTDCNEALADLIESLMQVVGWKEALARACNELLAGEWVELLLSLQHEHGRLWPSQRDGIAQALYVLDNTGAVLIADAAGSGKTRMGACLIQAIAARQQPGGRLSHQCNIICPPGVIKNWREETARPGPNVQLGSSGLLGRGSRDARQLDRLLAQGDMLLVDEAHNYHNLRSNRSQKLLESVAEYLLLFTATPINRSARDLLVLINLLGADSLGEQCIGSLGDYLGRGRRISQLAPAVLAQLADEIRRFTVRRTIPQLKAYIEAEPGAYCNILGHPCTYPAIQHDSYSLEESEQDCLLAGQVALLTASLKGLNYLQKPITDEHGLADNGPQALADYVHFRLASARYLAAYNVMNALRSSKYVLLEQLIGHEQACRKAGIAVLPDTATRKGALLDKLGNLTMPQVCIDAVLLPDFLTDSGLFEQALRAETTAYEEIVRLAEQVSTGREEAKVRQILRVASRHDKLLVFEERRMALRYIHHLLHKHHPGHHLHLAMGGTPTGKVEVCEIMGLPGRPGKHIALCSDAMAEGVNLQSASAMVMLDRPSVIRLAEQRVGRIERLDSPHDKVDIYWPLDAEAFRLQRDEKFIERFHTVKCLLGSNLTLPEAYAGADVELELETIVEDDIRHYPDSLGESQRENGRADAFYPVRSLYEGKDALFDSDLLEKIKMVSGLVVSRVGLVAARHTPWVFVCLAGSKHQAARWLLMTEDQDVCSSQLEDIAGFLKQNLGPGVRDIPVSRMAALQMEGLVKRLKNRPELVLSRRRLAVLSLLKSYLDYMSKMAAESRCQGELDFYFELAQRLPGGHKNDGLFDVPNAVALEAIADTFQQMIKPLYVGKLKRDGNKRLVRYRDLLKKLKQAPFEFETFSQKMKGALGREWPDPRVASVIFGLNP